MADVIAQRYHIFETLGEGGMGTVYRGEDTGTQRLVAIKRLKPNLTTPDMIARFVREAEALRELNHPNIVKMLDYINENDNHYLIIEYLAGGDLRQLLTSENYRLSKSFRLASIYVMH